MCTCVCVCLRERNAFTLEQPALLLWWRVYMLGGSEQQWGGRDRRWLCCLSAFVPNWQLHWKLDKSNSCRFVVTFGGGSLVVICSKTALNCHLWNKESFSFNNNKEVFTKVDANWLKTQLHQLCYSCVLSQLAFALLHSYIIASSLCFRGLMRFLNMHNPPVVLIIFIIVKDKHVKSCFKHPGCRWILRINS